jgi:hypothetical protein
MMLNCGTIGSDNDSPPTWGQFVLLITTRFGPQFIGKPLSMLAPDNGMTAQEGARNNDVLLMTDGDSNNALSANGNNRACNTVMCDILGASNGEVVLCMDESIGDVMGGIPVSSGVGLSTGDLPGDNSMDVLLGNCTTMVLTNVNLDGAAISRRPKQLQRRRHQCGRLWHGWQHQPRRRQQLRCKW